MIVRPADEAAIPGAFRRPVPEQEDSRRALFFPGEDCRRVLRVSGHTRPFRVYRLIEKYWASGENNRLAPGHPLTKKGK
jgi:hypothetical protein